MMRARFGGPAAQALSRSVSVDRVQADQLLVRSCGSYAAAGPRRVVELELHAVTPEPAFAALGYTHSAALHDGPLLAGTLIAAKATMNGRSTDPFQFGRFSIAAIENAPGDPVHFYSEINQTRNKFPFCISHGLIKRDVSVRVWLFAVYPDPYLGVPSTFNPSVVVWGLP